MGQPFWHVPHRRNPVFTGRGDVIADLRRRLTQRGRAALGQVQAICGLGGIGKTQTAVEYAYRYRDKYLAVLWATAESTLALKAGFAELARRMHLPHPQEDLDQGVIALKGWLEAHPGWLLILDNADDPNFLAPFLPDAGHGHVLITSRAQDFQNLGVLDAIELPNLPVADATTFLLRRSGREDVEADERDAAERLARELGGLPLALEQAAAYIKASKGMRLRRYLESYRGRGLDLLNAHGPALGRYPESMVTTWAANFEAVEAASSAAADVLRFSAFLAPDDIPFELVSRGAPELGASVAATLVQDGGDATRVNDLLQQSARYSLIRIDGHSEAYGLHRLVQEVLKDAMVEHTLREWAEHAVRAVSRAFPSVEHDNWPLCGRLLPHALAVASWIEQDRMRFAEAGQLLHQTADYLYERGQYAEAEPLLKRAMEVRREALGERHPDYAASLNDLASLYHAMGRHAEAEPLYHRAMEVRREALGERHPDYAASLNDLAELYRATGRHAEAEPLYQRAMEVRREALGERHPDYAASLNDLASLYSVLGRHAEAEPLLKRAMEVRREALGERHPDYAASLNDLASLYHAMGRHAEAEPLLKRAMEVRREALGERHPDYADSLNNLASLYYVLGRHAEAEPLYQRAMEVYREALGERHPAYAASLNNLASLYYAMGRHAEAEPLYQRAMEVYREALGERHPDYAASLNNLAGLYHAMGRHAEAEPLLKRAMEVRREALGERHPDYAASLNNLAGLYHAMGRHAEAEPLLKRAMEVRREALGSGTPTTPPR